ncbi:Putative FAD-linked oxidase-like, FAD-binding domain, PCMH-type, FAD-binding, type PCMH, subdomain 2 [Septoria linicola]|uniref:Delta(24)-sterol reductase n=1 Tax=Septoria linicola TaxID=215465 RepID=A0A9Q9AM45_9PEZI|nr:putative FAD-linked oxidase-like, FAD-binding domain, PCMH-type, FAD-binding, type PCMH, subdomain 2 [Septoria linicola]USW48537.1 Putative FAD-linked oxidase-like, FAD-binding domain, PCMH-type, FAD-binding, type PCMH, subdomain 2 [Septoria linicola]
MEAHDKAVSHISSQVECFHTQAKPYRIYHGSTNSTRDSRRDPSSSIDTSKLNNIISIDTENKIATVEPNVPMDDFVRATYQKGLVSLVVMEFPGITVGGGFAGTSGESSSFRHGFFDSTVQWIEIVVPTGEIHRISRDENPELFWGAAGSFGTLGVVTLLKIQLRDATEFVEMRYYAFDDMDAAMERVEQEVKDDTTDYLDGIVFARDNIVICSGRLTNTLPTTSSTKDIVRFTRPQDRWFYQHVQRRTANTFTNNQPTTIYTPLYDYLFRYDRGAFWVGRYAFSYFLTPFNRITRYILDSFMHTRVMYHALHASGQAKIYIIQDVAIPYPNVSTFHNWLDDTFAIYPIWLCPLRQRRDPKTGGYGLYADLANEKQSPEYMMNFGVWGPGSRDLATFLKQNRELEHKVDELGGRKWLYAHAYYTEEEFWSIYDKKEYDALREKYGAGYLPTVYDKVKVKEDEVAEGLWAWLVVLFWSLWPLSGLYGVWKAWRGGEYLMVKRSEKEIVEGVKEE